jgi:hypothetical protein
MRKTKAWLCAALIGLGLAGSALLVLPGPSDSVAQEKGLRSHWRFHEGHWSYWHEPDRRWYYTDGTNWFYHDNNAWAPYAFDRDFGREGFERGVYKLPGKGVDIVVPRHHVYIPK